MSLLHSSTRRPAPLKDADYDHSISLIDHTTTNSTRPRSADDASRSPVLSGSSSRPQSESGLGKHGRLHRELTRRKYAKYQDRRVEDTAQSAEDGEPEEFGLDASDLGEEGEGDGEERVRTISGDGSKKIKNQVEPESVIDILYENQRGGFLCGIPLFSGKALGNIDPSQWTNVALKPSATNTSNAQVPDPSWEWTWREWTINHSDEVDEDGWEYSFMFSDKFSWHGPSWWNSFVRRRAWIRKRTKKHFVYASHDPNMLSSKYFSIQPSQDRSRSRASTKDASVRNLARRDMEEGIVAKNIQDINSLMVVLRFSRIDREKMEAVESFIKHGSEELYHLKERMHDIMGQFIFQASRRLLLAHIVKIFNEESDQLKETLESEEDAFLALKQRLDNLEAAIKAADEEVKRLEYWSDVKDMVENGETKGAVDESQGWDKQWTGLDDSGPKDVISNRDLPGVHSCPDGKENGPPIDSSAEEGKGKAKEV